MSFLLSNIATQRETGALIDVKRQYNDSMNVYEYAISSPTNYLDPEGLWVVGIGVGISGTFMFPSPSLWTVGLSVSYSTQYFAGYNRITKTRISKTCATAAVTVIVGLGVNVSIGGGFLVSVGPGDVSEGFGIQCGCGAGRPIVPGGFGPSVEVTVDVDIGSGLVTATIPKLGLGAVAYIGVRITGSCTGCSPGFSPFSGAAQRQAKIFACLGRVQTAIQNSVESLDGVFAYPLPYSVSMRYRLTEDHVPTE